MTLDLLEKVAENPQLEARDWWQDYNIGEAKVKGPGAPYQFSETPWQINETEAVATSTEAILKDIGWTKAQEHQQ